MNFAGRAIFYGKSPGKTIQIMTIFQTDKLDPAAFLCARGAKYIGARHDGLGACTFEFEDPDLCFQLVDEFHDNAPCPAKSLLISRKQLLSEIKRQVPFNNFSGGGGKNQ